MFPTPPTSIAITSTSQPQATSLKQQNNSHESQICTTTISPNTMTSANHTLPPMMGSPLHDGSTDQSLLDVESPKSLPDTLSPKLSHDMPSSPQLFHVVSPSQSLTDIESTLQSSQKVVTSNIEYIKPIDSYSHGVSAGNIL